MQLTFVCQEKNFIRFKIHGSAKQEKRELKTSQLPLQNIADLFDSTAPVI
jgi:hypothetical protein